jgi:hypothetical protein
VVIGCFLTFIVDQGNGSVVLAYKLQQKRFRFKPKDPEPHPDDSDSAPEDGVYDEPWRDVCEISASLARELGKPAVLDRFKKYGAAGSDRPRPELDRDWFEKELAAAQAICEAKDAEKRAQLTETTSVADRKALEKAGYCPGQTVAWPVVGLRPGTRYKFRVNGKNYLGYPAFSPDSHVFATRGATDAVVST